MMMKTAMMIKTLLVPSLHSYTLYIVSKVLRNPNIVRIVQCTLFHQHVRVGSNPAQVNLFFPYILSGSLIIHDAYIHGR